MYENELTEYIYKLVDPRNRQVRYVGRTNNPDKRLMTHLSGRYQPEKYAWIIELRQLGLKPKLEVIEIVPFGSEESPGKREVHWIQFYTEQGADLLNKPSYFSIKNKMRPRKASRDEIEEQIQHLQETLAICETALMIVSDELPESDTKSLVRMAIQETQLG